MNNYAYEVVNPELLRSSSQNGFCSLACVSGTLNCLPVLPIQ